MNVGSLPIPYWMDDPDYYQVKDPRRPSHMAEIKRRRRLDGMVSASAADGSYSVFIINERKR